MLSSLLHHPHPHPSAGCGEAPPLNPGESGEFTHSPGGFQPPTPRKYLLHLPTGYNSSEPTSIVFAWHGFTGTSDLIEDYSGLSAHADANNYVVVYPQGTDFVYDDYTYTSWNDGVCSAGLTDTCTEDAFSPCPPECGECSRCDWCTCYDDIGAMHNLLDILEDSLCLDRKRVFGTGFSNGGMFTQHMGCHSRRFAAVAPFHGQLHTGYKCEARHRASIMQFSGTTDCVVPYDGATSYCGYFYEAAEDSVSGWRTKKSQWCKKNAIPYPTSADGTRELECREFPHCLRGSEVVYCLWDGDHTWPADGTDRFTNDVIWTFFQKHPKRWVWPWSEEDKVEASAAEAAFEN